MGCLTHGCLVSLFDEMLSRALHTATLAFAGEPLSRIPRCINADVRERMWLSSDVGSPAGDLAEAWGKENWDCSALENTWWYTDESWRSGGVDWRKPGQYVHVGEPEQPFKQRLENFKAWLLARPELCIAVTLFGYMPCRHLNHSDAFGGLIVVGGAR